jgi:hypothetical protein
MSAVFFLVVAAAISLVGSFAVWLRHRQPRRTLTSGMDTFRSEMAALAPERDARSED